MRNAYSTPAGTLRARPHFLPWCGPGSEVCPWVCTPSSPVRERERDKERDRRREREREMKREREGERERV
jgi:hypothetical protein